MFVVSIYRMLVRMWAGRYRPERHYRGDRRTTLEQWADLAALALEDAGLSSGEVNGLVCANLRESEMFVPHALTAPTTGRGVPFAQSCAIVLPTRALSAAGVRGPSSGGGSSRTRSRAYRTMASVRTSIDSS